MDSWQHKAIMVSLSLTLTLSLVTTDTAFTMSQVTKDNLLASQVAVNVLTNLATGFPMSQMW